MKKLNYLFVSVFLLNIILFTTACSEDTTPSIYEKISPTELPVTRYYNFDEKNKKEIPYAITIDANGTIYVSVSGQGIKKITGDSLTVFAPKGPETFFKAITIGHDGAVYAVRGGIKGIYRVAENTAPAAFVASSQGIADNINDIEYDAHRNIFWAGGNTGIIYRITPDKQVKKFTELSANINSLKMTSDNLYIALTDTNDHQQIWTFPIINVDSIGAGQFIYDFTEKTNSFAKVTDIVLDIDGNIILSTDDEAISLYTIYADKKGEEIFNGKVYGSIYSFVWGNDNFGYFTNILLDINNDVWKINMGKNKAQ